MRTTLILPSGAAALVVAPYASVASPRRDATGVSAGATAAWLRPANVWGLEGAASALDSPARSSRVLLCASSLFQTNVVSLGF